MLMVVSSEASGFHFLRLDNQRESDIFPTLSTKDLEGPLSSFQLTVRFKSSLRGRESFGKDLEV